MYDLLHMSPIYLILCFVPLNVFRYIVRVTDRVTRVIIILNKQFLIRLGVFKVRILKKEF